MVAVLPATKYPTALPIPIPPTNNVVTPTRPRNSAIRSTKRCKAGLAWLAVRTSQPASGNFSRASRAHSAGLLPGGSFTR